MSKFRVKHVVISFVLLFALIMLWQFSQSHKTVFFTVSHKYHYLFKDSIVNNVDSESYSCVTDNDILNQYVYYPNLKDKKEYYEPNDSNYNFYHVAIWDFKKLKDIHLNDVSINTEWNMKKTEFLFQETLDSKSFCPISIKFLYNIDGINLNVSRESSIIEEYKGDKFKGFYGFVDKLSISNENGEPQVYFNFEKKHTPIILLFYKDVRSFYLIMIYSTSFFDKNIFNILNIK
jgi:hypothetical protein